VVKNRGEGRTIKTCSNLMDSTVKVKVTLEQAMEAQRGS
jgi:hypothetical protein